MRWIYIDTEGHQREVKTCEELGKLFRLGQISDETYVWSSNFDDWKSYGEVRQSLRVDRKDQVSEREPELFVQKEDDQVLGVENFELLVDLLVSGKINSKTPAKEAGWETWLTLGQLRPDCIQAAFERDVHEYDEKRVEEVWPSKGSF